MSTKIITMMMVLLTVIDHREVMGRQYNDQ